MYPDFYRAMRAGIAAAGLLASLPIAAQNLLLNPGFATALAPWQPFNGFGQTTVWSNVDAGANPDSGSAYVTIPADSLFRQPPGASQCVAVQPNTTYVYGGKAYLPSASAADGADAFASAQFFPVGKLRRQRRCIPVLAARDHARCVDRNTRCRQQRTQRHIAASLPVRGCPNGTVLQMYFDDMFLIPDAIFGGRFD